MKYILLIYILFFSISATAEDCSFNKNELVLKLKKVLLAHPGGKIDESSFSISWQDPSSTASYYSYGGCEDLGSVVKKYFPAKEKLSETMVFEVASKLAKNYWSKNQAEELIAAIAGKKLTPEKLESSDLYVIESSLYSDLHIEYNKLENYVSINLVENL